MAKGDRFRNKVIHTRKSEKTEIACRVDRRVLKWLGHVENMNANCLIK